MATLPPNKFKELYEGGFSDAWIVEKAGSGKTASAEYAGVCPGCKGGKLYLRQDSDAAQCAHCGVMITATDLALLNSKARPAPLRIHVLHQGSPPLPLHLGPSGRLAKGPRVGVTRRL
jgi:hypothetical protein